MDTPGQAVSAIMYASGLIYLKGENPIYLTWTRDEGGGGPYLAEWDSSVFDTAWLDSNLAFLQATLSATYVQERMCAAAKVLANEPEADMADRISGDAYNRSEIIDLRIDDLVTNLALCKLDQDPWDR